MDRFLVNGGHPLQGSVDVHGAKNSALKLMAATLLAEGTFAIHHVPDIADIETLRLMLEQLGCTARRDGSTMHITVPSEIGHEAPYELVRRMRASIVVLGPLLARLGRARVAMPGGCNIGSRPVDWHLRGLERLGATIGSDHGFYDATGSLQGAEVVLDWPSHGATENVMMAATLAKGTTVISNAARDPEIVDLAAFLSSMGARIAGAGTHTIAIEGVDRLHGCSHATIPDRLEAGTYLMAVAATGGEVLARGARADHLDLVLSKLGDAGAEIDETLDGVRLKMEGRPRAVDFVTLPYPGFPTDLQPQMIVVCALAEGTSIATENIFENRYMFVDELKRMGADIRTEGHHAVIGGRAGLQGAPVASPDIRAGAALVIAGLAANGLTEISGLGSIDRGYERLEEQLTGLGADIVREPAQQPLFS